MPRRGKGRNPRRAQGPAEIGGMGWLDFCGHVRQSGRMRTVFLLLASASLSVSAIAQTAPDPPSAPAAVPAPAVVPAAPAAPADSTPAVNSTGAKGQKMICRTTRETGSLVKSTKRCYTAEQWALIEDKHRESGKQIQERNAGIYNPP